MQSALEWIDGREDMGEIALFLDFDGTLAPIVDRPGDARPLDGIADLVESIGERIPVGVISGRGLDDVFKRLGVAGIYYSGSHGMEIQEPDGSRDKSAQLEALIPEVDRHEAWLRRRFSEISEVEIERKRFGVAVHFRRRPQMREEVEKAVRQIVEESGGLRAERGKMVREVQPDVDRDKGTALRSIWNRFDAEQRRRPIYIGDDRTDEDAFSAIQEVGLGILVAEEQRPSAARLRLSNPEEVRDFLRRLSEKLQAS